MVKRKRQTTSWASQPNQPSLTATNLQWRASLRNASPLAKYVKLVLIQLYIQVLSCLITLGELCPTPCVCSVKPLWGRSGYRKVCENKIHVCIPNYALLPWDLEVIRLQDRKETTLCCVATWSILLVLWSYSASSLTNTYQKWLKYINCF